MASAIASLQTLFVLFMHIQQQNGNKNLGVTEMVLKHKFNYLALWLWVSERHTLKSSVNESTFVVDTQSL